MRTPRASRRGQLEAVFLVLAGILFANGSLPADDGDLDPSFGTLGSVVTSLGVRHDRARDLAIDVGGRLVVVGSAEFPEFGGYKNAIALARYLPDGSLDPAFQGTGMRVHDLGFGISAQVWGVVLQPDGKILAVGWREPYTSPIPITLGAKSTFPPRLLITRYHTNGSLDSSFGGGGLVSLGTDTWGRAIALQNDTKLVVVGAALTTASSGSTISGKDTPAPHKDFLIARLLPGGALDASFGSGGAGTQTTGFSTLADEAWDLAIQPDGKIVVVGDVHVGTEEQFGLARYTAAGVLDPSFGPFGNGRAVLAIGDAASAHAVALQRDGKIVVAGRTYNGSNNDMAVARFTSGGLLDKFGVVGVTAPIDLVSQDRAWDVLLQANGKILVAGVWTIVGDTMFALGRYRSNGDLDLGFGYNGFSTTFIADDAWGQAVKIGPDGIIVAGYASSSGNHAFAVARYELLPLFDDDFESGDLSAWSWSKGS